MNRVPKTEQERVVGILRSGGIGVLPTDTIYGIMGSALNPKTVRRIYRLRRRNPKKPMIILIGSMSDIRQFGVHLAPATKKILKQAWPGKVSVILGIKNRESRSRLNYLHRGTNALAFRLPKPKWLRDLLQKTGSLVAPSANPEGKPPAKTIREAKKYFGRRADFYINAGRLDSPPSTLIAIEKGKVKVLRPGAVSLSFRKIM
ncbi:MAG TPA: L-threonylcarbamoyladenylate synthase [Candidatus Paceibacterota bacterium]|nr:L-threonylcarbamoyladenylate synthase [Candidatus Paceibacterota bacterium]